MSDELFYLYKLTTGCINYFLFVLLHLNHVYLFVPLTSSQPNFEFDQTYLHYYNEVIIMHAVPSLSGLCNKVTQFWLQSLVEFENCLTAYTGLAALPSMDALYIWLTYNQA